MTTPSPLATITAAFAVATALTIIIYVLSTLVLRLRDHTTMSSRRRVVVAAGAHLVGACALSLVWLAVFPLVDTY